MSKHATREVYFSKVLKFMVKPGPDRRTSVPGAVLTRGGNRKQTVGTGGEASARVENSTATE